MIDVIVTDSKSLSQSHSSVTGADNIKKDDGSYKSGGGGGGVVPTPLLATMQGESLTPLSMSLAVTLCAYNT